MNLRRKPLKMEAFFDSFCGCGKDMSSSGKRGKIKSLYRFFLRLLQWPRRGSFPVIVSSTKQIGFFHSFFRQCPPSSRERPLKKASFICPHFVPEEVNETGFLWRNLLRLRKAQNLRPRSLPERPLPPFAFLIDFLAWRKLAWPSCNHMRAHEAP